MRLTPIGPLAIDEAAAREKLEDVVPRLHDFALHRLAAPHEIAHALFRLARNAHDRELPRAIEPRELPRIVLVVLALQAWLRRNERRRDHLAAMAPLAHCALQHVARAARFVA